MTTINAIIKYQNSVFQNTEELTEELTILEMLSNLEEEVLNKVKSGEIALIVQCEGEAKVTTPLTPVSELLPPEDDLEEIELRILLSTNKGGA